MPEEPSTRTGPVLRNRQRAAKPTSPPPKAASVGAGRINRKKTGGSSRRPKGDKASAISLELTRGRNPLPFKQYSDRIELTGTSIKRLTSIRVEYEDGEDIHESIYPERMLRKLELHFKPGKQ